MLLKKASKSCRFCIAKWTDRDPESPGPSSEAQIFLFECEHRTRRWNWIVKEQILNEPKDRFIRWFAAAVLTSDIGCPCWAPGQTTLSCHIVIWGTKGVGVSAPSLAKGGPQTCRKVFSIRSKSSDLYHGACTLCFFTTSEFDEFPWDLLDTAIWVMVFRNILQRPEFEFTKCGGMRYPDKTCGKVIQIHSESPCYVWLV